MSQSSGESTSPKVTMTFNLEFNQSNLLSGLGFRRHSLRDSYAGSLTLLLWILFWTPVVGHSLNSQEDAEAKLRRAKQYRLNDLKYELMVLNQNLGTTVPGSRLAEEMHANRKAMQEEIVRLEAELLVKPLHRKEVNEDTNVKRVQDDGGKVRIWSSSSQH